MAIAPSKGSTGGSLESFRANSADKHLATGAPYAFKLFPYRSCERRRVMVIQSQLPSHPMPDAPAHDEAVLELISPENTRRSVPLTQSPFLIGRGEAGKPAGHSRPPHLSQLRGDSLRGRTSTFWRIAEISSAFFSTASESPSGPCKKETSSPSVSKIPTKSYSTPLPRRSRLRISSPAWDASPPANLLPSASANSICSSKRPCCCIRSFPSDAVLEAMLDRAITITNAERGLLLEATNRRIACFTAWPAAPEA